MWYQRDDESVVVLNVEDQSTTTIDLDTNDVVAWAGTEDDIVWIEQKKRNYLLKKQKNHEEAKVMKQWPAKNHVIGSVVYDGKRIVWSEEQSWESKVYVYDLETEKTAELFAKDELEEARRLTIYNEALYLIGTPSYREKVYRYDFNTRKTTVSGQAVSMFALYNDKLVYVDRGTYLVTKSAEGRGGFRLHYSWSELAKNNQKLWNDLRYSFQPEDIYIRPGNRDYSWGYLLENPTEWERLLKSKTHQIKVSVTF